MLHCNNNFYWYLLGTGFIHLRTKRKLNRCITWCSPEFSFFTFLHFFANTLPVLGKISDLIKLKMVSLDSAWQNTSKMIPHSTIFSYIFFLKNSLLEPPVKYSKTTFFLGLLGTLILEFKETSSQNFMKGHQLSCKTLIWVYFSPDFSCIIIR